LFEFLSLPVSPALDHESGIFLTFWTSRGAYPRVRPTYCELLHGWKLLVLIICVLLATRFSCSRPRVRDLSKYSGHRVGSTPGSNLPVQILNFLFLLVFRSGAVPSIPLRIPGPPLPVISWFLVAARCLASRSEFRGLSKFWILAVANPVSDFLNLDVYVQFFLKPRILVYQGVGAPESFLIYHSPRARNVLPTGLVSVLGPSDA
jgi:hypothetical protein